MNPLLAQLTHRPFPEVAEIILAGADEITHEWDAAVRDAMPQMQNLTFAELKNTTPEILRAIAHALASDDPDVIRELVSRAPAQGLSRFRLHFDVLEIMQEDRLLRAIIVQHLETHLGRRMEVPESGALHAIIDVMLQRSVIALVDQQKSELRAAAKTELKFLSFLSHDLNNNLNNVTMSLLLLETDLKKAGGFDQAEDSLERAQESIFDTVTGMRRMLQHARLRISGKGPTFSPVDLNATVTKILAQFSQQADAKGAKLTIDMRPGTVVESDGELLTLILQNLVGNGLKYINSGAVRVGFSVGTDPEGGTLWVSDDGPGIAPEMIGQIFEAFRRGDDHGQEGLGLGLAIVSQAANLLGATMTVESTLGSGSTFRLALPKNDQAFANSMVPTDFLSAYS